MKCPEDDPEDELPDDDDELDELRDDLDFLRVLFVERERRPRRLFRELEDELLDSCSTWCFAWANSSSVRSPCCLNSLRPRILSAMAAARMTGCCCCNGGGAEKAARLPVAAGTGGYEEPDGGSMNDSLVPLLPFVAAASASANVSGERRVSR
jgi:hypothetical protein